MKHVVFFFCVFSFLSCSNKLDKLPYLGNHTDSNNLVKDYFQIPDFKLVNQDSVQVTNETLKDKVYIADFIFLRCPTICPIMNMELKRVYDIYEKNEDVIFVSHTIDPENDSISMLKAYAEKLGVKSNKWHFLHGDKKAIYNLAEKGYFMQAYQDLDAPGGYAHSGGFILVDKNKHIRGVYDGTNTEDVNRLMEEIAILLKEN